MNYSREHLNKKKQALKAPAAKVGRKFVMVAVRLSLFAFVLASVSAIAMGIGIFRSVIANAPNIENLNVSPSEEATFVYTADGTQLQKLNASTANRIYVTIDKIPKVLQLAVVAIEDERFYEHNGIDPQGILRAATVAAQSGTLTQGASTITQQLLKNNVFTGWTDENTSEKIRRKLQEQYLALKLEEVAGKDTILENYLNTINLGAGAYGVQAASLKYFNKDVSELTLSEASVLAGITKNPTRYNPLTNPQDNAARRSDVLAAMVKCKFITAEEAQAAKDDDVYSRIGAVSDEQAANESPYTYFMDAMIQQVIQDLQDKNGYSKAKAITSVYSGGLKIYATQDLNIQAIADEEFANEANYPPNIKWGLTYAISIKRAAGETEHFSSEHMTAYYQQEDPNFHMQFYSQEDGQSYIDTYRQSLLAEGDTVLAESIHFAPQPQAAMVILDQHTGEVKAVVGGRGDKETNLSWNRATDSNRQPGSSIKPIGIYGPAIDTGGMTLAQTFNDAPTTFSNGVTFSNADNTYAGPLTIRRALQLSKNTVAVKVVQQIGTQTAYQYLVNLGLDSLTEADSYAESIALGGLTNGASPLEMAGAYASFAHDGVYQRPIFYTKIVDGDGNIILDNSKERGRRVFKSSTAELMTNSLISNVTEGIASNFSLYNSPVAGKTGTTDYYKDEWFCGFTPYYTGAIWVGYDNAQPMDKDDYYFHSRLWTSIMNRVHADLAYTDFPSSGTLEKVYVCRHSGLLANEACIAAGTSYGELFEPGTAPLITCPIHKPKSAEEKKKEEDDKKKKEEEEKKKKEEEEKKRQQEEQNNSDSDSDSGSDN